MIQFLNTRSATWYRNVFFLWLLLIWTVSSIPSLPEPEIKSFHIEIRLDYLFHLGQYFVLAWIAIGWQHKKSTFPLMYTVIIIMVVIIIIATGDEFHQKLIPGRRYNPTDNLFNILGVVLGSLTGYLFWRCCRISD